MEYKKYIDTEITKLDNDLVIVNEEIKKIQDIQEKEKTRLVRLSELKKKRSQLLENEANLLASLKNIDNPECITSIITECEKLFTSNIHPDILNNQK
jgi:hypothetical protein